MKIATTSWKIFHQRERILICVAERGVIKYHPCPAAIERFIPFKLTQKLYGIF
jgi:hypothetical protein